MADFDDIVEDIFDSPSKVFGRNKKRDYYVPCPRCGGKFKYKKGIYKCNSCGYWTYAQQQAPGYYPGRTSPMPPRPPPQQQGSPGYNVNYDKRPAMNTFPSRGFSKNSKPILDIDIIAEDAIRINRWDQFDLLVMNKGDVDIMNVKLKFQGPLEIQGHQSISYLAAGENERMTIGLKAIELGRIPVTIIAEFETAMGDIHKHSNMDWITVIEDSEKETVKGQVINIGSIDNSTRISDSVVTRSDVGGSGGGSRTKSSISITDSVVTGSNIGGGDEVVWDEPTESFCGNCGNKLKHGWKACPKCGRRL